MIKLIDYLDIIEQSQIEDIITPDGKDVPDFDILDKAESTTITYIKAKLSPIFDISGLFDVIPVYEAGTYNEDVQVFFEYDTGKYGFFVTTATTTNPPNDGAGGAIDDDWIMKDNRNSILVDLVVRLTLCRIFSRIAHRDIPDNRKVDCKEAKKTLEMIVSGELNAGLTTLQGKSVGIQVTSVYDRDNVRY